MNNNSLYAQCNDILIETIEADPDIAGTGVRADLLRKWLDYVR